MIKTGHAFVFAAGCWALGACDDGVSPPARMEAGAPDGGGGGDAGGSLLVAENPARGARLQPVFLQAAGVDGADLFQGFFDSQLNVDCRFVTAADGVQRCLPRDTTFISEPEFADDACTIPVVRVRKACQDALYASRWVATTCPSGTAIARIGDPVAVTKTFLKRGACSAFATVADDEEARALGADLPPTSFIAGTRTLMPTSDPRLGAFQLTAEDGATMRAGWRDLTGAFECSFGVGQDGNVHCLPVAQGQIVASTFADEACAVPVAATSPSSCEEIAHVSKFVDGCPRRVAVYRGGARLASYHAQAGGMCQEPSPGSGTEFGTGPLVATETLIAARYGTVGAARRLLPVALETTLGRFVAGWFEDTALGTECNPRRAADGSVRCLPRSEFSVSNADQLFADAACSQPVILVNPLACRAPVALRPVPGSCPQRWAMFPVGTTLQGPLYRKRAAACDPTPAGAYDAFEVHSAGSEIPVTEAVLFTRVLR